MKGPNRKPVQTHRPRVRQRQSQRIPQSRPRLRNMNGSAHWSSIVSLVWSVSETQHRPRGLFSFLIVHKAITIQQCWTLACISNKEISRLYQKSLGQSTPLLLNASSSLEQHVVFFP